MDNRTKTWVVLGGWTAYVFFWFFQAEAISNLIARSNVFVGISLYLLGNPGYLLLLYVMYRVAKTKGRAIWKRVVSSILTVLAFDLVTLPRLTIASPLTNGVETTTNIGSIVMRSLEIYVPHSMSFILTYIFLPIIFMSIAVELAGITNFIKDNIKR